MIYLKEHTSSSYGPRTWHNAAQGVTLAYAVDHTTAGEKLTQKAAKGKIVMVDANDHDDLSAARALYMTLKHYDCKVINVAGNGIYTFNKHGIGQKNVNDAIYNILSYITPHWGINHIVSGGQSGADIAGLIAAQRLGIDCTGMWPKGYKMRFEDGKDVNHTPEQIMEILRNYA